MNKHSESNRRGRPVSADHSARLVSMLAEAIDAEIWRNRGYYGHDGNGIHDDLTGESLDQHPSAMPAAQAFIDGPLSDLSVLVQIPEVRELAELLVMYRHSRHAGTVVLNTHMIHTARNWVDALEVTS